MKELLKPCPFCGTNEMGVDMEQWDPDIDTFWVVCKKCQASGPMDKEKSIAIRNWNHRPL